MLSVLVRVCLVLIIAAGVIAALVVPQPKLVTYKKANLVSTSIYWAGLEGDEPVLLDTDADIVRLDENTGYLHLCHQESGKNYCQKFKVVTIQGADAVLSHWLSH